MRDNKIIIQKKLHKLLYHVKLQFALNNVSTSYFNKETEFKIPTVYSFFL